MVWQLQDAKNKFSEVVEKAISAGPQEITRRGKKAVILMSVKDYFRLKKKNKSIVDFFKNSPLSELSFERVKDYPRSIDL